MSELNQLILAEKYRPKTIDDCILPEATKRDIKNAIASGDIPNLVLYGGAGSGKTSLCYAIANETNSEILYINASLERSIDVIRNQVMSFSSTVSLTDSRKIVLMDECLSEDTSVRIGTVDNWIPIQLRSLELGTKYPVVSFNLETGELEDDIGEIISDREDDLFEVTLSDGTVVTSNSKHPFICVDEFGGFYERTIEEGLTGHMVVKF